MPGNYHPVSLTSIAYKTLESISKTVYYVPFAKKASNFQMVAWPLPEKSCPANQLAMEEKVTRFTDSDATVDTVLLDFVKALVSVNHRF